MTGEEEDGTTRSRSRTLEIEAVLEAMGPAGGPGQVDRVIERSELNCQAFILLHSASLMLREENLTRDL